jgi:hypothetical protein
MNKEIEWMQSIGKKYKCSECKKYVKGIDGYICIKSFSQIYCPTPKTICWNCFSNALKEIISKRGTEKERKENYKLLIKKRILRNLK